MQNCKTIFLPHLPFSSVCHSQFSFCGGAYRLVQSLQNNLPSFVTDVLKKDGATLSSLEFSSHHFLNDFIFPMEELSILQGEYKVLFLLAKNSEMTDTQSFRTYMLLIKLSSSLWKWNKLSFGKPTLTMKTAHKTEVYSHKLNADFLKSELIKN